jgi:TRAP-type C4-dicarboxylate transport system permease small subunit
MALLHRLDTMLAVVERALIIVLLSGLIGLGFLQMLLRNLFASGMFWADDLLRHAVVWLGILGASLATRAHKHLSCDVLTRLLPSWCQRCAAVLTNIMAALICMLLSVAAWKFLQDERTAGTMLAFGTAAWIAQSIFPLGFVTMALRFLLHALSIIRQDAPRASQP